MNLFGNKRFAIGLEFGSEGVDAMLLDIVEVSEAATVFVRYPNGFMLDPENPSIVRRRPQDYIFGLIESLKSLSGKIREQGFGPESVSGIGLSVCGSIPIPVDRSGKPLAFDSRYENKLAAQAWVPEDGTGIEEATEITAKAKKNPDKYLRKCGGTYPNDYFFSRILRCKRENPEVFRAAFSWAECSDFLPGILCGNTDPITLPRNICAAGHKAMYHENWNGLPSEEFLEKLDRELVPLRSRYAPKAVSSDNLAGYLCESIAVQTGLISGIPVAIGGIDTHFGAVGAGVKPGLLVKKFGPDPVDITVASLVDSVPDIPGICGVVPGSVIPGMYGLEAGQKSSGSIPGWFESMIASINGAKKEDIRKMLVEAASNLLPGENGLLALDWNGGNRSILGDTELSGLLVGQSMRTSAPEIYRALIESIAFGSLTIIRRLRKYGITVGEIVKYGTIPLLDPLMMQILANVCNLPVKALKTSHAGALGGAIFGSIAGKVYPDPETAIRKLSSGIGKTYYPDPEAVIVYSDMYDLYRILHDSFGTPKYKQNLYLVMKDLMYIRNSQI